MRCLKLDLTVVLRNGSKATRVVDLLEMSVLVSNRCGTGYGKVKEVPRLRKNKSRALAYRKVASGLGSLMRFLEWSEAAATVVRCSMEGKSFFCGVVLRR